MYDKLRGMKRRIAIMLIMALTVGTVAGCNSKVTDVTSASSSVQSSQSEIDEGITFPLKEQIKLKIYMVTGESPMNDDSLVITELEKLTNIDFEIVQTTSATSAEKQATMLASGDFARYYVS